MQAEVLEEMVGEIVLIEGCHGLSLKNGIEKAFQELERVNCNRQGGCHRNVLNNRWIGPSGVDA